MATHSERMKVFKMSDDKRVSVTIDNGVADVRLVRAEKMNALDDKMFEAIIAAGEKLKSERSVRAVVLSGEGRAFCAGLDTSRFGQMADGSARSGAIDRLIKRRSGPANMPQYAVWVWRELPMPVIAAVHGTAFGGGFQLMLSADMRYIAPDTKLSIMEAKWGLVPDMCGMQLMRHIVRDDIARELTYTARVFSGEDALRYGFATRLAADPHAQAMATAREIANKSPNAVRAAKRLFTAATAAGEAEMLMAESVEQEKLIGSPNQKESIMANLQKRAPNFAD
ncbi:putative enoyl-CoA hydratase echA6 [Variibacter gotjawalensis]|uniref:Putative enoyl-CoA hydratase echA6 n=2 Tax=Variibacter gotjawalensis TaxID=1333996 RepID=A0A0S3PY54_9BRAD|nr:enoyl-CoA hydratase/carnithine racemase [Variibacter gotjawalensis]BAT60704.1 putative enoyl-CoA hydratase echA6 [Variibacter gotjawalensis]